MGHRMSALPTAQFCGQAPKLSAQHGAQRSAAVSKAIHARLAGSHEAGKLLALLTKDEREYALSCRKPVDMVVAHDPPVVCDYDSAEKELEVALDHLGLPTTGDDPEAATVGHLDFAWVREVQVDDALLRVAYVGDIKKTVWSCSGPDSLQLLAYGYAYAALRNCQAFCTGLWIVEDSEWIWSEEFIFMASERADEILSTILHAASNEGEASMGAHCDGCFSRLHCPEWALPAVTLDSWLGDASKPDAPLTSELLLKIQAAEDILEQARKNINARVDRGEVIRDAKSKKRYLPIFNKGRESLDKEAILRDHGDKYLRRGASHYQHRWVKDKLG